MNLNFILSNFSLACKHDKNRNTVKWDPAVKDLNFTRRHYVFQKYLLYTAKAYSEICQTSNI